MSSSFSLRQLSDSKKSWEYIPKFSSIDLRPTYLGFNFFIFAFDILQLFSNL